MIGGQRPGRSSVYAPVSRITVYRSPVYAWCRERFIVLRVSGLEAELEQQGAEFALTVDAKDAERALRELEDYAAESTTTPAPPQKVSEGWPGAALWVVVLLAFYFLSGFELLGLPWSPAGMAQSGAIRGGEWWRVVTALCLHVNVAHLAGNMALGGLLVFLLAQRLGLGLASLGVLLSGAFGNAINALVQPATHSSIGASTAVFGALGMLAVNAWQQNAALGVRPVERFAPLVSGLLLLGMFGMAGERTDVVAHTTGFFSGLLAGTVFASFEPNVLRRADIQTAAGAVAAALLGSSWLLAVA